MDRAIGMIVRYNRIMQNMSQASLVEGICVPSYLSKIETCEIQASEEVLTLILSRLKIVIYSNVKESKAYVDLLEVINLVYSLKRKEAKDKFIKLSKELVHSTCIHEYLALELFLSDSTSSETSSLLKASLEYLEGDTAFLVNMMLYFHTQQDEMYLDRALRISLKGFALYTKGMTLSTKEAFGDAFDWFKRAEIAFLSEGNLNGIIQAKRHQAILLALREDKQRAIAYFGSLMKLLQDISSMEYETMKKSCIYNINYLKYQLGEPNDLADICEQYVKENAFNNFIPYHMLYEIYAKVNHKKALMYLENGLAIFDDEESLDYAILNLDYYKALNQNYNHLTEYYQKLKSVYDRLDIRRSYGIKFQLHADIITYLKANRKYKEALDMIESIKSVRF